VNSGPATPSAAGPGPAPAPATSGGGIGDILGGSIGGSADNSGIGGVIGQAHRQRNVGGRSAVSWAGCSAVSADPARGVRTVRCATGLPRGFRGRSAGA